MKMGFEKCHPAVNFIYFATVIAGMIVFQHPIFLGISFVCAFVYSVKRNGWKALVFNAILIPCVVAFAFYYSSFNHFGVTVLQQNRIGNNMTLESLVYGFVLGFVIAGVIIWFSCVHSVFTTDKVVYLFGKVSPRLSLFLAIILRMVPRIKKEAKKINTAQRGIGRGAGQGNFFQRVRNFIRILSMLITWTIESMTTASESMRSRGSSLRGRKAFSIYRFDNRDRAYVIGVFATLTVTMMAVMLKQTDILYDPRIIMTPISTMSYVFYTGYALFCLMPMGLELWTEYRFWKARKML
jgi:energy-coupling factor transport system permease protein